MKVKTKFCQADINWAGDYIGKSRYTMGGWGCLISAYAMRLNTLGWNTTPAQLNRHMTRKGAFTNDARYYWGSIGREYELKETVIDARHRRVTKQEVDELEKKIESQPIVQVDYNPWTARADMHFVIVEEMKGDDLIIVDPIDGKRKSLLKEYGRNGKWNLARAIYRIVYLEGEGKECLHCPIHCE